MTVMFKYPELADDFERLDPRLRALALEVARWQKKTFGVVMVITCIIRTPEQNDTVGGLRRSAHLLSSDLKYARAFDCRSRGLTPEAKSRWVKYVEAFNHGLPVPLYHVICHDSGAGEHMHVNLNRWAAV